jgi:hypothetical protein
MTEAHDSPREKRGGLDGVVWILEKVADVFVLQNVGNK